MSGAGGVRDNGSGGQHEVRTQRLAEETVPSSISNRFCDNTTHVRLHQRVGEGTMVYTKSDCMYTYFLRFDWEFKEHLGITHNERPPGISIFEILRPSPPLKTMSARPFIVNDLVEPVSTDNNTTDLLSLNALVVLVDAHLQGFR